MYDLKNVDFGDGVYEIDESAFAGCTSLEHIVLPDGLKTIDDRAFQDCTALTDITLPADILEIDQLAFFGCSSLSSIHYGGSTEQWQSILFGDSWDNGTANYTVSCTDGTLTKDDLTLNRDR